nr:uncharacterized protein YjhX (UPF0386 family) [Mucilaginibacter sp. X4EP1]NYE66075.1 uncharacterized protein YjhX (UPF0386 family) [Mucilaginibacter sp. E4BP6]
MSHNFEEKKPSMHIDHTTFRTSYLAETIDYYRHLKIKPFQSSRETNPFRILKRKGSPFSSTPSCGLAISKSIASE